MNTVSRTSQPILRRFATSLAASTALLVAGCASGGGDTFVNGPGAGSNGFLEVTPAEAMTSAGQQGGPFFPMSKTYQLANPGANAIDWSTTADGPGVLFLPENGTLAAGETVDVTLFLDSGFTALLPPGDFEVTAQFRNTTNGSGDLDLPVSLSVAEDGELDVFPGVGFSSSGDVGGPFAPTSQAYTLTNSGVADLDWEASTTSAWTVFSSSAGTLTPGQSTTVTVAIDEPVANALAPGIYVALVNFREVEAGNAGLDLLVSLDVQEPASLAVTPPEGLAQLGPAGGPFAPASKTYVLTNTGGQDLEWVATSDSGSLDLVPSAGTLAPGASVSVVAGVNAGTTVGLAAGTYQDSIHFTNLVGDNLGSTSRPATLEIVADPGVIAVTPSTALAASGPIGGPFLPSAQTYTVANTGGSAFTWSAIPSASWVHLSSTGGTLQPAASTQVTVSVDASVAGTFGSGNYTASVLFDAIGGSGGPISRGASLSIAPPSGGGDGPVLPEGPGFGGPTATPPGVGSGPGSQFEAIAKADVVPWQEFTGEFEVGVVAFHRNGIERVDFSADGGPWTPVTEMTVNPRTSVAEYWVKLESGAAGVASDRTIEVRAIAYPNVGKPRVLELGHFHARPNGSAPTIRYASPSGSDSSGDGSQGSPYRTIGKAAQALAGAMGGNPGGGIVRLQAGTYDYDAQGGSDRSTPNAWLTIEPAPGVAREDVQILDSSNPGIRVQNVRLRNLTVRTILYAVDNLGSRFWFDQCDHRGYGSETSVHVVGWTYGTSGLYWTDGLVRDDRFGPLGGLVRGMTIRNLGEDAFRGANPVINTTVDNMNRGSQSSWHPDLFQHSSQVENYIYYGLRATNVEGQGLHWKWNNEPYRKNYAIVNVLIEGLDVYSSQVDCDFDHMVMRNCTMMQAFLWRTDSQSNHCFQGNIFERMGVSPSTNSSFGSPSESNVTNQGVFDHNHYIATENSIEPGTNVTTGAITFLDEAGDDYRPVPGQGLSRSPVYVPVDVHGNARTSPATVGAHEE